MEIFLNEIDNDYWKKERKPRFYRQSITEVFIKRKKSRRLKERQKKETERKKDKSNMQN